MSLGAKISIIVSLALIAIGIYSVIQRKRQDESNEKRHQELIKSLSNK